MPRSVLVVGAGIAGSTLAALLGRAGHRVTLIERDSRQRSSGIALRNFAVRVVRRI